MNQSHDEQLSISIIGLSEWKIDDLEQSGRGLLINTTRGDLKTVIHHDPEFPTDRGVIWLSGASGGFDGPANGVYRKLSEKISPEITSLRVDYRMPNNLIECVLDVLASVSFLTGTRHKELVLVGHSFGGAVAIKSSSFSPEVKSVIALASQTHGATEASLVSPRSLLLIHGDEDTVLDPECSQTIFNWAKEPKELILINGTGHSFREKEDDLTFKIESWIKDVFN